METKKSSKANLEKGKTLNFLIGIVLVLSFLFVSFEWGIPEIKVFQSTGDGGIHWIDEIPNTLPEPQTPPPPPPKTTVTDILTIVDDKKEVADKDITSTEDTPDNPQTEPYKPPVVVDNEEEESNTIFVIVEEMPQYPGGDTELLKFISRSIKYPMVAQENGTQGRVICSFVINTDGHIVDAEILRGIDPALDKEALRVINTMPKWKPGKQRGKPVRVRYTIPIIFRLQ